MLDKILPKGNSSESKTRINTIVGEGTNLAGDIVVSGGIRIDGKFTGNLKAEGKLTVGRSGIIKSENITTQGAIIAGKVEVNHFIAAESFHLKETAEFYGSIQTKKLIIEEGAVFQGSSTMRNREQSANKKQHTPTEDRN